MQKSKNVFEYLFFIPLFVLIFTRIGIEICAQLLPLRFSWIPSFIIYYISIEICLWFARKKFNIVSDTKKFELYPLPTLKLVAFGLVLPALLPLGVLIVNYKIVSPVSYVYIIIFAAINPFFEEGFWRGLLINLPVDPFKKQLFSGFFFSFSHYFLWGSYWLANPRILIPTCITTFIMGWCWMWFYQKNKRLIYPILSHMVVDIFNLSVVVFLGLKLANT